MSRALPSFSYWVEPASFAAGAYPGAEDRLEALIAAGIRGFVDLTEGAGPAAYAAELARLAAGGDTLHRRFPIADFGVPTPETMRAILDRVDAWRAAKRPLYVHCRGGLGRTGTVIACWLVRHGSAPSQAFTMLDRLRKGTQLASEPSPETEAQCAFVSAWRRGQ